MTPLQLSNREKAILVQGMILRGLLDETLSPADLDTLDHMGVVSEQILTGPAPSERNRKEFLRWFEEFVASQARSDL